MVQHLEGMQQGAMVPCSYNGGVHHNERPTGSDQRFRWGISHANMGQDDRVHNTACHHRDDLVPHYSELHVATNNGNTWILVSWCPNRRQQEFRMGNRTIGFFNRGYQRTQLQLECGNMIRFTTNEEASIQSWELESVTPDMDIPTTLIWENNVIWSYNMSFSAMEIDGPEPRASQLAFAPTSHRLLENHHPHQDDNKW